MRGADVVTPDRRERNVDHRAGKAAADGHEVADVLQIVVILDGGKPQCDERGIDNPVDRFVEFARERDWEQFHAPKNLAMALAVEAGEVMEHFQWLSEEQSEQLSADKRREVAYEVADVFIFTMRLSQRLGIDLAAVVDEKIKINEQKYPADKVRGSAKKYTEY